MARLSQKIALVTGSSRGIGAAIAKCFAYHGARVVLQGRDLNALSSVQRDIHAAGGDALLVSGDLRNFAEIEVMRHKVEDTWGPIEILVANAGASYTRPHLPLEQIPEDGWRAAIDGNLTATFLTLKSVLPSMKQHEAGAIVTISSAAARRPSPLSPLPYAAAKAGIELLSQELAAQVGPFNIRVNCIAPETILTENNEREIPEALKPELAAAHPLKRLGTPEDVANAALFLVSDEANWITGVVLDVAGGAVLAR